MVGQPQLFPKEFKEAEDWLLIRFQDFISNRDLSPDRGGFTDYPKLRSTTELEKKALSIDYTKIEPQEGFMGKDNPWMNSYKSHIS